MIGLSILALTLVQAPAALMGVVVDPDGKVLAGVEILLSCGRTPDGRVPVIDRARTDQAGKFRIELPAQERLGEFEAYWGGVWAYQPGKALACTKWSRLEKEPEPVRLTIDEPGPRSIVLKQPDGTGTDGARVAPVMVFRPGLLYGISMPDELVDRLAVATGPDGVAELPGIATEAELLAVRVDLGEAEQLLALDLEKEGKARSVTVALKPECRLVGKVVTAEGKVPGPGVALEVWSDPGDSVGVAPVRFRGGPVRVEPDGAFRTPPGLRQGATCRVVVRAERFAPRISPWVVLEGAETTVPTVTLRPLREIAGRVVDRAGQPVAQVDVFQAGDGPEKTTTRTDDRGRFLLGGYDRDRAFVFAEKQGFRFQGLTVDLALADEVQIVLTRDDEAPERAMPTLPDPLPREVMVDLAKRLIEPYLQRALRDGSDGDKYRAFFALVMADPSEALERAEQTKFGRPNLLDAVRGRVALQLVKTDPDEAAAVVETISEPGDRAGYLVDLSDALPESERPRRIGLLDRAALQAKAATKLDDRLWQTGEVAERLFELGETAKARSLFEDGKALAEAMADKTSLIRGLFGARLARIDPAAGLAMIEEIKDPDRRLEYVAGAAWRVATVDPARAEAIVRGIGRAIDRSVAVERVVRVLARLDLPRAQALIELADGPSWRAHAWLFLGEGVATTNPEAAREAFRHAAAEFARLQHEPDPRPINPAAIALPLVEAIDPAFVAEVLWRALALRESSFEPRNPLGMRGDWYNLPLLLARYDRKVAAVAFESGLAQARAMLKRADRYSFILGLTEAMIDPREAAAMVESMPTAPRTFMNEPANWTRIRVAEHIGRDRASRWKSIWRTHTGIGLTMYDRE
jgi:hypothetical protein